MNDTESDIMSVIEGAIQQHPRSQQKRIGPSEIGIECDKRILNKLAGVEEPPRPAAWKPAIGTAVHAQLEEWFNTAVEVSGHYRWVTEQRVNCGAIGDQPLTGSCDLYDDWTGTVVDWKIIGPKQLANYRAQGPSQQYRVQAHTYGLGFARNQDGWSMPKTVAIMFLPRDGELGKAYFWSEPWQPTIALDAINRVNKLDQLWRIVGIQKAVEMSPGCTSPWCPWCKADLAAASRREGASLFD